jgi:hypothetical protein
MELMFDMQQYGQPPAEIIKDLAPGLKFDENGMPIMVRDYDDDLFLCFVFYCSDPRFFLCLTVKLPTDV